MLRSCGAHGPQTAAGSSIPGFQGHDGGLSGGGGGIYGGGRGLREGYWL
jgi:hypothetical protein